MQYCAFAQTVDTALPKQSDLNAFSALSTSSLCFSDTPLQEVP